MRTAFFYSINIGLRVVSQVIPQIRFPWVKKTDQFKLHFQQSCERKLKLIFQNIHENRFRVKNCSKVLQHKYSWIFFLANFDDKFPEPIIEFTLVDDIQNSGSTWGIVSLSEKIWTKSLRSSAHSKQTESSLFTQYRHTCHIKRPMKSGT